MLIEDIKQKLTLYEAAHAPKPPRRSAVLVPLIFPETEPGAAPGEIPDAEPGKASGRIPDAEPGKASGRIPDAEPLLLFEQRSFALKHQPGEVCFPGGKVEEGETPRETALREICEELLISPEQVEILSPLNAFESSTDQTISAFVGRVTGYRGSFSRDEVEQVFTIPLSWFLTHEPNRYTTMRTVVPGEDFPYDLIPGGRNYPWKRIRHTVPVYPDTDPVIWGLTARITDALCKALGGY